MSSDQELIDALRRRDPATQQAMLEHCDKVCAIFCRKHPYLNEPALGLKTYEKLLKKIDQGEPIQNLWAFINRIATNTCIDALRKHQERKEQPLRLRYLGDETLIERASWCLCGASDPADRYDEAKWESLLARLRQCIEELNPRDGQITRWCLEGRPRSWIAAQLDPPDNPNNIDQKWYRIRQRLKRCCHRADDTDRLNS